MKKLIVLLASVSMLLLFTSAKDVNGQKTNQNVAYADQLDHPIQPPIG